MSSAGWLHLLLAALHYDVGDREAAEASRDASLYLGEQLEDREIQAWAFETPAYFAIFEQRPRDALALTDVGLKLAPPRTSIMAALHMQQARAWARLHVRQPSEEALSRGADVIDQLPIPEHPEHHFVFDRPKFAYYAGTTYSWLGIVRSTEKYVLEVMKNNSDPAQPNWWPGRVVGSKPRFTDQAGPAKAEKRRTGASRTARMLLSTTNLADEGAPVR